ncbi:MAG: hypothetical protein JWM42_841 [Burkholderia sp.]|nr:hypothetical protein [Burkholderia sp.]
MGWRQGQAYGQDVRDRVLGASGSIAEVALRFGVSESFVERARWRRRLGEDTPGAHTTMCRRTGQAGTGAGRTGGSGA